MSLFEYHIIIYVIISALFAVGIAYDLIHNKDVTLAGFLLIILFIIFTLIYGGVFWW